jgi:hypothetical protein
MAFTYTGNLSDALEYVRFLIGDKDPEVALYQDEEINFFLSKHQDLTENNIKRVALKLLKLMLNEILRGPSRERSGGYEVYQASAESLKLAVNQLEAEIRSVSGAAPSFGGVYSPSTENNRDNPSYVSSKFTNTRIFGEY